MRIIFFVIMTSFFLMTYFNVSNSQCPCGSTECYDSDTTGCEEPRTDWYEDYEDNITVPMFPQCSLRVWYCSRQCGNENHTVQIMVCHVSQMSYCDDPQCDSLWNYLTDPSISDDERGQRQKWLMDQVYVQLSIRLYQSFVNSHPNPDLLECPNYKYKTRNIKGACAAYCYTQNPYDDPDKEWQVSMINCTESFCCKHQLRFCLDPDTHEIVIDESWEQDNPVDCETVDPPPVTECPPGTTVDITPCINSCTDIL